jgi:branched-chain amino acid transport system permease protein
VELSFVPSVLIALAVCAIVGVLVERLLLRHMVGQPAFAVIMVTIGLLFIIEQLIPTLWGHQARNLGDPWGVETVDAAGLSLAVRDLWTLGLAGVALGGFFLFDRYTRYGLAMRATALDQEAALAQGISARRVFAISWGIAGIVAALAGVTLASGAAAVNPTISFIALAAFPAMILGGLDSPIGAVVAAAFIGVIENLAGAYLDFIGDDLKIAVPFIAVIVILVVRPQGLFGRKVTVRV